eukprot:1689506-Rhodomonas_salina.3
MDGGEESEGEGGEGEGDMAALLAEAERRQLEGEERGAMEEGGGGEMGDDSGEDGGGGGGFGRQEIAELLRAAQQSDEDDEKCNEAVIAGRAAVSARNRRVTACVSVRGLPQRDASLRTPRRCKSTKTLRRPDIEVDQTTTVDPPTIQLESIPRRGSIMIADHQACCVECMSGCLYS